MMDRKLQDYYENRLSMMGEPAWKDLMEDVEAMLKATNTLDGVTTTWISGEAKSP